MYVYFNGALTPSKGVIILKKFENKVWLATPTMHGEEIKYITEAYDTNWMSTIGENINAIEQQLSQNVGCKYAVALASGTSASCD